MIRANPAQLLPSLASGGPQDVMSRALQAFVYGVPAYERRDGTGVTRERYRLA